MKDEHMKSGSEVMEALLETGLGLAVVSAECVKQLAQQASPRLSPLRQRGEQMIEELRKKGREKGPEVSKFACAAADWVKEKSGLGLGAEVHALREKVALLEQEIARLRAERAGAQP